MQSELEVTIILNDPNEVQSGIQVAFDNDITLIKFRRKCSKLLRKDILAFFTEFGEKVTDFNDFKKGKKFFASETFYLKTLVLKKKQNSENLTDKKTSDQNDFSKNSNYLHEQKVNIEFISHPNSGKTTLIHGLIGEPKKNEGSRMIEVVYYKKESVGQHTYEFYISDVTEGEQIDYSLRLRNKRVIVIALSKDKIINIIDSNSLGRLINWIKYQLKEIQKYGHPSCKVYLAILKYDIFSDCELTIDYFLNNFRELEVVKVSEEKEINRLNIKNASEFLHMILDGLIKTDESNAKLMFRRKRAFSTISSTSLKKDNSWISKIKRLFLCV